MGDKMNKILGICIYRSDILRGIISAINSEICEVTLIGSKKKIMELCNTTDYYKFKIIDSENYIDITIKANELLETNQYDGVIFGDYPKEYIKNIISVENKVYILDLVNANHLIFIPSFIKTDFIDHEDKRKALSIGKEIIKDLNINYYNIGMVSTEIYPSLKIERNLLKSYKELENDNIDIVNIKDIFNGDYNLLIFNDGLVTGIFIETILINKNNKFAEFMKKDNLLAINGKTMSAQDVLFSLFLLNKMTLYAKAG